MKSLVLSLSEYVTAMFKDIAYAYQRHSDWKRDQSRLLHELGVKGNRVITIDLPALDKHFCKCLAVGLYVPSRSAFGRCGKGKKVPVFMQDLFLQIFDNEGKLRLTPNPSAIAVLRQVLAGAKKLPLQCTKKRVDDEVKDFCLVERDIRRPSLNWDDDELLLPEGPACDSYPSVFDGITSRFSDTPDLFGWSDPVGPGPSHLKILGQVFDRVAAQLGDFSSEESFELPKHGPGAVADLKASECKYSFADWPAKLDGVFPFDTYGTPNQGISLTERGYIYRNREVPSRLISVPKTPKAPRLIAAEPSSHQWIQQLVMSQLESRIKQTSISPSVNFHSQEENQRFAFLGSINGSIATVDLSAASDRLSCWLVERAFRVNHTLLLRLHASRTRWIANGIEPSLWAYLRLKKFAPMGSAETFPLQTIIYACIAIASVLEQKKWPIQRIDDASNLVRVFGDDICLPSDSRWCLQNMLTYCGLKVNVDKTFSEGFFRESCGTDYYKGNSVAPVYLSCLPEEARAATIESIVKVSNNFHSRGYWNVASFLASYAKQYKRFLPIVPFSSRSRKGLPLSEATLVADYLGFASFSGGTLQHLAKRWNKAHQKEEVRILTGFSKPIEYETPGVNRLFQWFTESPDPLYKWRSGRRVTKVSYARPGWGDPGNLLPTKKLGVVPEILR